ncbi:hypothetical protein SCFA_460010 [anaerobic digester metagenome]|uniref:Uncharacterized protein n=1 Tax=anaerobic digester metagenome TaxID=1263854 RepID=A0A485MBS9_9ZZZZ
MSRDAYGLTGTTGLRFYLMWLGWFIIPSCVRVKTLTSGEGVFVILFAKKPSIFVEGFFIF